jgi:hypothetical protein
MLHILHLYNSSNFKIKNEIEINNIMNNILFVTYIILYFKFIIKQKIRVIF